MSTAYTVPDNPVDPAAFEAVISAWHEHMHCEMTTQPGSRCRRLAYWRADHAAGYRQT